MHRYAKKENSRPRYYYKIIVHRKVLPCPSCIYPWSYCRLPRKVYQRVFPENGQSPVSRVSSERQGPPPNSHSGHRVRANTELKYLDAFPRNKKEPRKAIQRVLGANGNNTH